MLTAKKNDLVAKFCQNALKFTIYPTPDQLSQLQQSIQSAHQRELGGFLPHGPLKTQIKDWFRKRREYLTSKIYCVCDDVMMTWWEAVLSELGTGASYGEVVEGIVESEKYMGLMMVMVRLPIVDERAAMEFLKKRVKDYFYKMCEPRLIICDALGLQGLDAKNAFGQELDSNELASQFQMN